MAGAMFYYESPETHQEQDFWSSFRVGKNPSFKKKQPSGFFGFFGFFWVFLGFFAQQRGF
jgi:hypothetical protein